MMALVWGLQDTSEPMRAKQARPLNLLVGTVFMQLGLFMSCICMKLLGLSVLDVSFEQEAQGNRMILVGMRC